MILGVAHDAHLPAETLHHLTFRDRLLGIVGAFAVHVREQVKQDLRRRQPVEDHDVIHGFERRHQFRAAFLAENRPPLAFQCGHGAVAVHAHHQHIAAAPCLFKITHMADVENIKTAVGEGNAAAFPAQALAQGAHFFARDQGCAHALRIASVISPRETVAVPRFITTIPPAQLAMTRGLQKVRPGGKRQRERGDHRVARAGHVHGLVRPEDGKVAGRPARLKQGHAIAPPRNQQRLESLAVEEFPSQGVQPLQIISNGLAESSLDLRFIGRGRRQVFVSQKVVAGVDGDGQRMAARPPAKGIHFLGIGGAVAVIGNQHARGGAEQRRRRPGQAGSHFRRQGSGRLAVDAHDLLALPVRQSSQNPHLRGSQVIAHADDVPGGNVPFTKVVEQRVARLIIAHDSHGSDVGAERRQVVRGIGAAARHHLLLALLQDQHRRFARDAHDFAVDGLVGDEVSQHDDALAREALQQGQQRRTVGG